MGPKTLKRIGLNVLKNRGTGGGGISAVHDGKPKAPVKSTLAWRDLQYDWNIDDDHDIPGTVKIMLSGLDPQRQKNQVVFSVPDRCFIPVTASNSCIELFDQNSTSIHQDDNKAHQKSSPRLTLNQLGTSMQSPGVSVDLLDIPMTPELESRPQTAASDNLSTTSDQNYDDGGSILEAEIADMKGDDPSSSSPKRKPNKGINHFSFCDRATQTSIPPTRYAAVQTEAPPRSTFNAVTNAFVIYDAYFQDQQQMHQKTLMAIQAANAANKTNPATVAANAIGNEVANPLYLQQASEAMLCPAALARLNKAAHIIERMLNQNTFDDIAQDFKYWEDAADEYREYDGTLMPLWRFAPPQHLLRMFQENGIIRSGVSTYVSCICLNPHYKDLFAMGLGSRNNMSSEGGLVNVFSLKSPAMPEQSNRLSAGVSSVDFHREYWQLLAVGLHDGHIVVLDLAVKTRVEDEVVVHTHVNRTSILRGKRTVPITQVKWANDSPDGNIRLLSISADGCLCSWLFVHGELYPTELITLPFKGETSPELESFHTALGSPMLTASCSAMALHGTNSMVLVGTDEGQLWPVTLDGELLEWGPILAHQGPVYTVEWNPFHPHVFLTCGADWLVKIWDDREKNPLVVLDFGCAVEDACWSPNSSTVFGCMVTKGRIAIYDLNIRLYKPLCSQRIVAQRRSKLTRMTFSPHHPIVMVGDDRGHVSCLKLSPNLRKVTPVPETSRVADVEVGKLERVIRLMKKQEY